ncbi:MAG: glycoside hydrolase family 44 protein [Ruminococcus sp.]|nr:glycoside hydrolase family 44 protein [Ruminococcus sp.]
MHKNKFRLKFRRILEIFAAVLVCINLFSFEISAEEPRRISIIIDTSRDRVNISPYIYGINDNSGDPGFKVKAVMQSGTYLDTYNWELDAANTGKADGAENIFVSEASGADAHYSVTALSPSAFMDNANAADIPGRFLYFPMAGYAAADTDGAVRDYETDRFLPLLDRKALSSEYMLTPNTSDGFVYNDEYLAYMINRFGWRDAEINAPDGTALGGITGYILGSEPEELKDEFPALNLRELTAEYLASDCAEAARTVKHIDPSAFVFSPGVRNLESYINLSNSADWETHSDSYSWFIDYFLDSMKKSSELSGERLLDSLDLQFFTEAVTETGEEVINSDSKAANAARIEAPRLFKDSTYSEASRSAVNYKAYTPLLPTLQASIRMYYPGTKLSFSEYSFGGGTDSSGGIAVADTLGIFGESGIYMAGLSKSSPDYDYESAGLKIYTDYDGAGNSFSPVSVYSENSGTASVYAATGNVNDSKLTVIYINKSETTETAHFLLFANSDYDSVRVYGFDEESPEIVDCYDGGAVVTSNIFEYAVPARSVYMFEFTGIPHPGAVTTAPLRENETITTTPAVTDPYGATITDMSETETVTAAPAFSAETEAATTISAPESSLSEPADGDGEIPLVIRIIAILLIFTVAGVFAYVIFKMFRT